MEISNHPPLRTLFWLAATVLLVLLFVSAYRWVDRAADKPPVIAVKPDPSCRLNSAPCTIILNDGGTITLSITPLPIKAATPLVFEITLSNIESREAAIDFTGVDMNMGKTRYLLQRDGQGRFRGEGLLPVCIRQRMEWQAEVALMSDRGTLVAPFRFFTVKKT